VTTTRAIGHGEALLAVTILLSALAPGVALADSAKSKPDAITQLAGRSPLCAQNPGPSGARNCRSSGAVEHPYPVARYGIDVHIDVGVTKPENVIASGLQAIAAFLWLAVVFAFKCVLELLAWAFSLDLLGTTLAPVRSALQTLHDEVLGTAWFSAAITALGLWAIWRGFVQRQTIRTIAGLVLAVVMMAGALAVINRPEQTVGAASRLANDASFGFVAGATTGTLRRAPRTLSQASAGLFTVVVLRPWCALQFGDVAWCLSKAPGGQTWAERWLRYDQDSRQRNAEYTALAGDSLPGKHSFLGCDACANDNTGDLAKQVKGVKRDPDRVKLQTKPQTALRLGLLVLVVVGMVGAIVLFGWLTAQCLFAALLTLVLLLASPAMILAPALGERGRALFVAWVKGLLAAIVAKAIFALALGVMLAVNNALTQAQPTTLPWLVTWLLSAILWWGAFLKRRDLLGYASLGSVPDVRVRQALRRPYDALSGRGLALGRTATRATAGGAVIGALVGRREPRDERRAIAAQAVTDAARDALRDRAAQRLDGRYHDFHQGLERHDDAREKLPGLRRRIDALDRTIAAGERSDDPRAAARATDARQQRGRLVAQRNALEAKQLPRVEEGVARRFVETADRQLAEQGRRFTHRQLDAQIEELRADATGRPQPGDSAHQWRARAWTPGIPDSQLAQLTPRQIDDLRTASIVTDLERDRALLNAVRDPQVPGPEPTRAQRTAAAAHLPSGTLRERRAAISGQRRDELLQMRRDEQRRQRARRGLHRRAQQGR
jgi:hypothetical protein